MEQVNRLSPFPIYDTQDIKDLKDKIINMDYDDDKVECCKECKWLHLTQDKDDNWWCSKCNTPNSIEELKDIFEYKEKYGHIWTLL